MGLIIDCCLVLECSGLAARRTRHNVDGIRLSGCTIIEVVARVVLGDASVGAVHREKGGRSAGLIQALWAHDLTAREEAFRRTPRPIHACATQHGEHTQQGGGEAGGGRPSLSAVAQG